MTDPRPVEARESSPRPVRRYSWHCGCGAPHAPACGGGGGMRPGPQYVDEAAAHAALRAHWGDHARAGSRTRPHGAVTDHHTGRTDTGTDTGTEPAPDTGAAS